MLSIYTRTNSVFSKEYLKWLIGKILGKKGGPRAVFASLTRGLDELDIEYEVNPRKPKYKIVHVLSGINALENALKLKKNGEIDKIIAGPNLVVTPKDSDKILHDENIDIILVPSKWIADFYCNNLTEKQGKKVQVWPAGTIIPNQSDTQIRDNILLFIKNVDKKLADDIENYLINEKLHFTIIKYGNYKQEKYYSTLEKSKLIIYLQVVESQGIALQEAWARNVPSLVLEKSEFVYPNGKTAYGQVSAPYLTKECGLFFKDFNDFQIKLREILNNTHTFSPHKYCQDNLSDKVSAQKYLDILKSL